MIKIIDGHESVEFEKIIELYNSVGWFTYTKDVEKLKLAFANSTYVLIATKAKEVL